MAKESEQIPTARTRKQVLVEAFIGGVAVQIYERRAGFINLNNLRVEAKKLAAAAGTSESEFLDEALKCTTQIDGLLNRRK
jgi:hypothetical protein